jgi:DNA end-binding protein Ku
MSSRPVWKGHIRFNLVTVPVCLYTAAAPAGESGVSFNQLHKGCGQRIRYKKCCPLHGEVQQADIVSGYQVAQDEYVIVDPKEIEAARPAKERSIAIASFVPAAAVDPARYTGKTHYLLPDGQVARKPYALLHRAMSESKRHALAQVVMSSREHVVLVRPVGNALMMHQLAYGEELKDPAEFQDAAPAGADVTAQELKMARMLVEAMADDAADLNSFRDTYTEKLRSTIEAKAHGRKLVAAGPADMSDRVINLMDALEKSLKYAKSEKPPAKRRKAS